MGLWSLTVCGLAGRENSFVLWDKIFRYVKDLTGNTVQHRLYVKCKNYSLTMIKSTLLGLAWFYTIGALKHAVAGKKGGSRLKKVFLSFSGCSHSLSSQLLGLNNVKLLPATTTKLQKRRKALLKRNPLDQYMSEEKAQLRVKRTDFIDLKLNLIMCLNFKLSLQTV